MLWAASIAVAAPRWRAADDVLTDGRSGLRTDTLLPGAGVSD